MGVESLANARLRVVTTDPKEITTTTTITTDLAEVS